MRTKGLCRLMAGLLTAGALVVVAGCSSGASAPSRPVLGTLKGILEAEGGRPGTSARLLPGIITISGAGTKVTATAGSDGVFSAQVAVGSYTVTGRSPQFIINNNEGVCSPVTPGAVAVAAGATVTVSVVCEEK